MTIVERILAEATNSNRMRLLVLLAAVWHVTACARNTGADVSSATADRRPSRPEIRSKLEELKVRFEKLAIEEDIEGRLQHYAANVISMPEYQPMLHGLAQVRMYYEEMARRQDVRRYARQIEEVIELDMAVVELGTFDTEYTRPAQTAPVHEQGKYWNVWAIQPDGSLKLESEIWGYFSPIANPASLFVRIDGESSGTPPPAADRDPRIQFELLALNTLMQEAVRTRDGGLRAGFFAADAIFMPHGDSPKRGIDEIREHLVEYNSGPVTIDSISIRTHDLRTSAGYVIEYPKFHVAWRTPDASGTSSGQGLRIWRRDPDCTLRLYREIGTHDFLH